jgi:protein-disulfide isomerase
VEKVLEAYPNDVKHVFKQFPLVQIHPHAMNAAKASIAAGKQGKFWEMHNILFKNFRKLQPEEVKKYAEEIGLDMAKFQTDLESAEVAKQISDDMALAQTAGVRGTPTIFVGGKRLMNRSMDGFKAMIDPALKK